ncbi:Rhodanese-related sulfurtransferase [Saccharicrinis carchari]|uniref:Rhodanese-related sulfurtransferase n=1 Tax=Saccharicrinis carchari TaxID=1168039 RepID=A0A521CGP6_SACCC|nr:rhodanese-like domain-containing protein [Saccharicrinis carchari]SMO58572.1 Rhodanese-related sulfurtransferase [Saccharicrinis carchari]
MRWIVLVLLLVPVHCFSQKEKLIECDDFYNRITSDGSIYIVDIRLHDEYQENRITDAHWGGNKETFKKMLIDINKKSPVFLYCEKGKRTKECAVWLRSLGYKNVYQLKGGFREWIQNGYPVDTSSIK